jgi:hypothetical protein
MEESMNASIKGLLAVVALALPVAAFAQSGDASSSDVKYCTALIAKYEQYLDQSSKRGQQPQGLDARTGIEKCKAGDTSGIPVIEKALKDAKYDLPPRT